MIPTWIVVTVYGFSVGAFGPLQMEMPRCSEQIQQVLQIVPMLVDTVEVCDVPITPADVRVFCIQSPFHPVLVDPSKGSCA